MNLTSEIKYLARRYSRYLTSGCGICWDSCNCSYTNKTPPGPSIVSKVEKNAYKKVMYGG
jgi:hypothetical protein